MELYVPQQRRIRRRRRRRGLEPLIPDRRDPWGQVIAGAVILSGVTVAIAAPAQQPGPGEAPGGRLADQSFGSTGNLRVGSLILTPSVGPAGSFDSNLFAAPNHERSDFFASFLPTLDVQSDWPRNAFSLRAQGDFRQYATYGRENNNNASIAGTGRIDLAPNAYLLAGGGYQLLHEDRGALVPVNGIHPTQYTVTSGKAGFVIEPAPLGLRLDARVDSYGYNNVALFGGEIAQESARDRVVYALEPRVSYRIEPQYDAYVRAVVNRRQYNSTREPDGLDRSSSGYAADLGTAFSMPGFASGELYLGYIAQNYDAASAKPIDAIDFGANMEWHPSEATSFRLNIARSVEESALLGSQGYLQTAIRLGVEHELVPRLALHGSLGFINADFAGAAGSSKLYEAKLGARYLVAANLTAGIEYDFDYRASNAALPSYTRQIVELRLRGAL